MTGENRQRNALAELDKAETALTEAKVLLDSSHPDGAVSRAYYSVFHAARALLLIDGIEPKTHSGVVRMLSLHWIQTNRLPEELHSVVSNLFFDRELADYVADGFSGEAVRNASNSQNYF